MLLVNFVPDSQPNLFKEDSLPALIEMPDGLPPTSIRTLDGLQLTLILMLTEDSLHANWTMNQNVENLEDLTPLRMIFGRFF